MMNKYLDEKKYNFWILLKEFNILIPIIQRDYVQGRKDANVNQIRENLLEDIKNSIQNNEPIEFDFIYGSIDEDNNLSLLDGQQRMTTLFLLYWYFATKESKLNDEVKNLLKKFSYKNRVSTRDFCKNLLEHNIVIKKDEDISKIIKNKTWFFFEWEKDPTVKNMLNMLDSINKKMYNVEAFDKLTNSENNLITFYFRPLEKFNLTDDLYIKMNSRGKKLTSLEIFKSKIIEIMKKHKQNNLLEIFKNNIDTKWTDLLWEYRDKEKNTIDKPFIRLIYFITEMIYAIKIDKTTDRDQNQTSPFIYDGQDVVIDVNLIEKVYKDENNTKLLIDILNLWNTKEEIDKDLNNTFCSRYTKGKVCLFEEDINLLAEKYNVFTSEKLKEVDIIKTSNITSTFSIGKDNIMRYNFDLGDIDTSELDNLFKNLKAKKKYFKLKNGNYLNLNNDNIKELENLVDDINLSNKDIKNGSGVIPKYRAIYLDSLKDKYNIIKTNSLFDEFINTFLKYKDTKLSLTKKDKEVLRDYQEVGVKWLYNIYKCGFGGILADEMGLGKSVQIIYLIKKLLKEDSNSKYLIVSPTSLVYNWENEFKKFAPDIKYETFGDIKNIRHEKLEKDNPSVYITSYGLLREDYDYYKDIKFNVCVIDEAQNIKNPNAGITKTVKSINANTKLALTGTPIENSALELWSIFDYVMDGFLGGEQEFGRKYNIKDFDEDTNKKLHNLNKLISPFVLRRRKEDVLKDLPDKLENNIFIDLSDSQKKLYAKEVERVNREFDSILHTEGISKARFLILQLLVKLRQLCIDPRIIYENYKDGSNKIDTLINVVKEYVSNNHKILLFTSFRTALDLVRKEFNKNGITSYTIDGSVSSKKRMELVDKFNSDDTNVFLIMLKSGGTGLNLTSADVVIHLDLWWNPQAESQATDRAHRIGQKNTVEVIKLVSKGTIEEKILELQQKKKMLSDKVIEGEDMDKNVISKLTEKELKELLSYEQKN